jgi:spore coat protein CotH
MMEPANKVGQVERSWWNRVVPVRIRHNIKLILGSVILLLLVGGFLGTLPLQPIVFSAGSSTIASNIENNIEGSIDLFDLSQPHSITLQVNDLEYAHMMSEFIDFEEKAWIEVDVNIDGTLLPSVGIRLKGNSTLMSLRGPDFSPFEESGGAPEGMEEALQQPGMEQGMLKQIADVSFEEPSTLPLLMSFNEFVPGRGYQGRGEIAIRSARPGGSTLNEGIALQLIKDSGQLSQQYSWVTFKINDASSATRLVIESPDQNYAASLEQGPGVLYKSRSSNAFAYHGEDQTLYLEDFSQINALGTRDLKPVIQLLAWVESASDEEFDAELADWIDIPSFAKYVVTHDLLNNFDDMAGPGRNFLFWYDLEDEIFTVINWDMNVAIVGIEGIMAGLPGGAMIGAMMQSMTSGGPDIPGGEGVDMASMMEAMEDGEMPEGFSPPGGASPGGMPGGMQVRPPSGRIIGNILKERFVRSEVFSEVIAATRAELLALWFESGRAQGLLTELSKIVPVSGRLTAEQIEQDVIDLTESIAKVK